MACIIFIEIKSHKDCLQGIAKLDYLMKVSMFQIYRDPELNRDKMRLLTSITESDRESIKNKVSKKLFDQSFDMHSQANSEAFLFFKRATKDLENANLTFDNSFMQNTNRPTMDGVPQF